MIDIEGSRPGPRRRAGLVFAAVSLALVGLVAGVGFGVRGADVPAAVAAPAPVTTTVTAPVTTTPTVQAARCLEDEPCFNSCVMGVNGNYPQSDSRFSVPGPCDLGRDTRLPFGRFLVAEVTAPGALDSLAWVRCDLVAGGWYFARVDVFVRNADGSTVPASLVSEHACVPPAPGQLSDGVAGLLPGMLREAARHA